MSIKGVGREVKAGIKGSKPRLRIPKVPRAKESSKTAKMGEEYLRRRNRILAIKEKREAMLLAVERDELVERELVIRQLSYFVIAIRQKLLALPAAMVRRRVHF
jgi:hypothetical protein